MNFYSPLRYPGGKGKAVKYFKKLIKENSLLEGTYIEPYAGGASVGLSLLIEGYVSKIIINDIDRSIYAFWYSVLNKTKKLCKLIEDTPITIEEWLIQKKVQKKKKMCSLMDLGFSTFFLNRTNRSGILNAGVIGGLGQTGRWKIDARYNKTELIDRIKKIARFKDRIELRNIDAIALVKSLRKKISGKALFYFDPPYYVKGKDLYLNYYINEDHKNIAAEISKIKKQRWVVTYDNVWFIKELYSKFRKAKYFLNYSAGRASKGEEIMIFSDNLQVDTDPILFKT